MKTGKKVRIILATILELINIAGIVLLTVFLSKLPVLPGLYLAIIYGVLLLLTAGSALLLFPKKKRKFWYIIGALLALLSVILTSVANYYLYHSISALGVVANQAEQKTVMGVYVRAEENITSVEQCAGMSFGIIGQLERDRTDQALAMAEQDLGETIEPQEYSDVILLVNGLLFQDCDVILLNEGYLEPLKEVEGYENLDTRIRQIGSYEIVTYVEIPQEDQKTEEPKEEEPVEPVEPGDPFLVYVSGLDTWGAVTTTSRSDVNILVAVNPQTRQILMVSTPRDYYVELPISNGQKDKLTHAGIYGIDVSMGTLEMLYGVDIDYYFKVNFTGFEGLIDALGGVTVKSDYNFTAGGNHYVKGANYLNGSQALTFARERHAFASGDRQRGKNQMHVIEGVIDKLTSTTLLTNYAEIMKEVEGTFATNMTTDEITQLIKFQLTNGGSWDVQSFSVSGSDANKSMFSLSRPNYVMIPYEEDVAKASDLLQRILAGEVIDVEG